MRIEVTDNGRGIPPDLRERCSSRSSPPSAPGVGTGLGLAICRDIVRRCGGELTLRSTVGEGTTLLITLPAA